MAALIELGESNTLEFKSTARFDVKKSQANLPKDKRREILSSADKDRQHDILKAVAAMLNAKGGDLVIGVDDEGHGFGIHHDYEFFSEAGKQNRDGYELWLTGLLIHHFNKTAAGCVEISFALRDGVDVCRLKISPSPDPVFVKKDKAEIFYRRLNNSSQTLGMEEFAKYRDSRFKGDPPARIEPKLKIGKTASKSGKKKLTDFRAILAEIDTHPNQTYFVLKSIVINNLFGVDIMPEAVEICKLRLFLKLMSTVEPHYAQENLGVEALPDIDFNIRAGNTLVGFTSEQELDASIAQNLSFELDKIKLIKRQLKIASNAFQNFRRQQVELGGKVTQENKSDLREELGELTNDLNEYLATQFSVDPSSKRKFDMWKNDHLPFHWLAEFYHIIADGGFSVIVGNPPYVEIEKSWSRSILRSTYKTALERWSRDEDVYTLVMERSDSLLSKQGRYGLIVPLSLAFSTKRPFELLRRHLCESRDDWWLSHFDRIPDALFGSSVRTRCTIAIRSVRTNDEDTNFFTTSLSRWNSDARPYLFPQLQYSQIGNQIRARIPKIGSRIQAAGLKVLNREFKMLKECLLNSVSFSNLARSAPDFPDKSVFIGGTAYNWFPAWREIPETTTVDGEPSLPARTAGYSFKTQREANVVFALLCSSLGYWWWVVASDGFNLKRWLIESFPINPESLSKKANLELAELGEKLRKDLKKQYVYKDNRGRIGNFYLPACREIVHEIDDCLSRHINGLDSQFFEDIQNFNLNFSTSESE